MTDTNLAQSDLTPVKRKASQSSKTLARNSSLSPKPAAPSQSLTPKGKLGVLVAYLIRPQGARIDELVQATGWQTHSVRGAISGSIKKKLGYQVISEKTDAGRVFRIKKGVGA